MKAVNLFFLLFVLQGCASYLAEVRTGYTTTSVYGGLSHGGSLEAHAGVSEWDNLVFGPSLRMRIWEDGYAVPELGPHAAWFVSDNQDLFGFYLRANLYLGNMGVDGASGASLSGVINPAFVLFHSGDVGLVTIGLTAEVTAHQGYLNSVGSAFGIQIGLGAGQPW